MKTKLLSKFSFVKEKKLSESSVLSFQKEEVFDDVNKRFTLADKQKILIEERTGITTIGEICKRENITPNTLFAWCREDDETSVELKSKRKLTDDDKHRIVLEGNNGEYSIAEICKREGISQEEFLTWSEEFLQIRSKRLKREGVNDLHTEQVKSIILGKVGEDGLKYFESYIDVTSKKTRVNSRLGECVNFDKSQKIKNLVCLTRINDIRFINKHFESINEKLPVNGVFIGCMETLRARRSRAIYKIPILGTLYFGMEFLIKRVLPKLNITKKVYFNITKGNDRLLSKAEGLGRLVSCGFKIMDFKAINGLIYFVVKKVSEPKFDLNPSYGPVYKMPRIGKNGKIIKVYKFRTMHPYSEYIQDYVVNVNGYAESGKPANDFRIPEWGKVFRKFWIDELPQLINVLKGEMKLVGIRPVSERYFQDIPKEMQKLRLTQKPGCIPPYVALNRKGNVMSVLQAEKEYLEEKIKNPYTTDIKYFFKALYNITINNKRSA